MMPARRNKFLLITFTDLQGPCMLFAPRVTFLSCGKIIKDKRSKGSVDAIASRSRANFCAKQFRETNATMQGVGKLRPGRFI